MTHGIAWLVAVILATGAPVHGAVAGAAWVDAGLRAAPAPDDAPIPTPTVPKSEGTPAEKTSKPDAPANRQPKRVDLDRTEPTGKDDEAVPTPLRPTTPVEPTSPPQQRRSRSQAPPPARLSPTTAGSPGDNPSSYGGKCFAKGTRCGKAAGSGIALALLGAGTIAGGGVLLAIPQRPIFHDPTYLRSYRPPGAAMVAAGAGLLTAGIVMAALAVVRHRRDTPMPYQALRLRFGGALSLVAP